MHKIAAALLGTLLLAPAHALACGGFFCNQATLEAIDQKKERILFTVNGDDTVTTVVEVSYEGESTGFSWVVPVSDVPTLDVVAPSTLRLLDMATSPTIIPPSIEYPEQDNEDWWGDDDDDDDLASDDDDAADDDPVDVVDLPVVGPFDPEVVSSNDAGALIEWLNDNGYLITPEMEPFIAEYVASGTKFLCMKLAPDAGVEDIAPISMTYPGTQPMIPLRLTAVGAEPDMQVLVFIAGEARYEPANVPAIPMPDSELRADPRNGDNNYFPLLSYKIDLAGGQGFATQYANGSADLASRANNSWLNTSDEAEARLFVSELASEYAYVTRMLTRVNAEEMSVDPMFAPMASSTPVSGVHDLRGQPPVWHDITEVPPTPCNDLYCGEGGLCAVDDAGNEGCACAPGFLARLADQPRLSSGGSTARDVTCVDGLFNLMPSVAGEGTNPCDDFICGVGGSCVPLNGSATCDCADGGVAIAGPMGQMTCAEAVAAYEPADALAWDIPDGPSVGGCDDERPDVNRDGGALAAGGSAAPTACNASISGAEGSLLALLLLGVRRRRNEV